MANFKRGFTIIELLISISVIGILAALITVNYNQSRIKAQDASIKDSVRQYRQAMELHYNQYKSYFVYDRQAGTCILGTKIQVDNGYKAEGSGVGCVGYDGSGEGQMTRRTAGTTLPNYRATSIADVLVKEGVLSSIQNYPGVNNFDQRNMTETAAGVPVAKDFFLTLCDAEGGEAQSEATAINFAIFAQPVSKTQAQNDRPRALQLCGSYPHGWNVLQANDTQ